MSRHLKPFEWVELFKLYEEEPSKLWNELSKYKKVTIGAKIWFGKKYRKFLYNNRDMNTLISKPRNNFKASKGRGRPKKIQDKNEIWKQLIKDIGEDEIARILRELVEADDKKAINKITEIINKTKLSSRQLSSILCISKSKICYLRNNNYKSAHHSHKNETLVKIIREIFKKYKERIGRKPIDRIMFLEYGIKISDRHVGRIMQENDLNCLIRRRRKEKESKNTSVFIRDIVNRDYNNENHCEEILATDVTYIESTSDCTQNHIYLSTVIIHRTKEIINWKLSKSNDLILALDTLKDIKTKNVIIYSDHGSAYSSPSFVRMLENKKWKQSMSRIGNSLDNRVIEFWFSILKTELIYNLDIKKLTFKELENEIENFVNYYNNVRIQEKLSWMSPKQYKQHLK